MPVTRTIIFLCLALLLMAAPAFARHHATKHAAAHQTVASAQLDRSGREQVGRASFYGRNIHRELADGSRFNPNSNAAASRTLPFGTTAKITNLKTGRSALIQVRDRGPLGRGRIVDVTPKIAEQLGMDKAGVAPVVVAPVAVPQPKGKVRLGAGAPEVSPHEARQAVELARTAAR